MNKIFFALVIAVSFVWMVPSSAQTDSCPAGRVCLKNPLGNKVEVSDIIGAIIKGTLGVLGSLSLFMMVWGGFQWLTSAGSKDKIEKGSKTMMWAIIGVIVVLSSYLLVDAILNAITG